MAEITNTDMIRIQLVKNNEANSSRAEFITSLISEWEKGTKLEKMRTAQKYYDNQNTEIDKKERWVIGRSKETGEPMRVRSKVLAENKLYHPFLRKMTRQKIAYKLSKPFTLSSVKEEDEHSKSMFEDVMAALGKSFQRTLRNTCQDAIVKTIGWIQVYYDDTSTLCFKRIPPEEIIPLWRDNDHTVLDALVRHYGVEYYNPDGTHETIRHAEYVDYTGIYYYIYDAAQGKYVVDTENFDGGSTSHFNMKTINDEGVETVVGVNWERIPFIPFKYDSEEQCLLDKVKSLIDDYDRKTSSISDSIDDFPNATTVIKNYDGANKEEFVHNKNAYRTIFVQGDGDAKTLETPLNLTELDKHLDRLREDIYEFGQGVDTQNKDIRDTSGVALRFLYADLDLDCSDWMIETEASIMAVIWFILTDIKNREGKDYFDVNYNILFNTDMIVNETETITNCMNSVGVISDETIIANHPWTKEVQKEIENRLRDQTEQLMLESEYGNEPSGGVSNEE